MVKYRVDSYSHFSDKIDSITFDDYKASLMWFNRSMTSDIYKIELYSVLVHDGSNNFDIFSQDIEVLEKIREK